MESKCFQREIITEVKKKNPCQATDILNESRKISNIEHTRVRKLSLRTIKHNWHKKMNLTKIAWVPKENDR